MPPRPPPPTSASQQYAWKLDCVTDDESTDSSGQFARISSTTFTAAASLTFDNDDDEEHVDETPGSGPPAEWWAKVPSHHHSSKQNNNKAGKRNNKKKKNKKKNNKLKAIIKKDLCFGNVRIQHYERCLGVDAVPLDGSWPLGIGKKVCIKNDSTAIIELPVDTYEHQKQIRLKERLANTLNDAAVIDKNLAERLQQQDVLETRQWDFKSSVKNPLFHLMTELHRMELLLKYSGSETDATASDMTATTSKNKQSSRRAGSTSLLGAEKQQQQHHHHHHQQRFNDVFTKVDVSHFRVQLEDIRAMRSIRDATGCSCHRLKVCLPHHPIENNKAGGGGSKTAPKKRLAVQKLKSELRRRNLLPKDNHAPSREELEMILYDAVEKEGCCDYGCPCADNGVGCQSDACDCWQSPNNNNKEGTSLTTKDIQTRCGNPNGMYTVDFNVIDNYRRNVLEKFTYCPPVQDEDKTSTKPVSVNILARKQSMIAT